MAESVKGDSQLSGKDAEDAALAYLQNQGLSLVVRNHRCRMGEIDLIMQDGKTLVFVEVRFRRSSRFGSAAESVDRGKQSRIVAAASHYLATTGADCPSRFDVVAMAPGANDYSVDWFRDAFQLG
jgi:putative endonuclease